MSIELLTLPCGILSTNTYLLIDGSSALIVDPAAGALQKVCGALAEKSISDLQIVITHSHWDHIGDVAGLSDHFKAPILVHSQDALNLMEPGSDGLPLWVTTKGARPTRLLQEGDDINIGSTHFLVLHTPGHTPGSICLYSKENKILFSGDTLFQGTYGNVSFPTSSMEEMVKSLRKLAKLPPDTVVLPGHGPSTTIGQESWLSNPE